MSLPLAVTRERERVRERARVTITQDCAISTRVDSRRGSRVSDHAASRHAARERRLEHGRGPPRRHVRNVFRAEICFARDVSWCPAGASQRARAMPRPPRRNSLGHAVRSRGVNRGDPPAR